MKRAIVTGATGMIGMALIKTLLKMGVEVIATVRPDSDRKGRLVRELETEGMQKKLYIVPFNLSDFGKNDADNAFLQALNGVGLQVKECEVCDAFFHLAWEGTFGKDRNDKDLQVIRNVENTLGAVWLAYKLGASVFVGAGSQAEYGRVPYGIKLNAKTSAHPENFYGMGKLKAGVDSRALCKSLGIRHVWCRILSVYGPGDGDRTMIMSGIYSLLRGETPKFTKGEQLWDYMYSEDAAAAIAALAEHGTDGGIYPIGSGSVRPLSEYIRIMCETIDKNSQPDIGGIDYPEGQVMYLCADISDLQRDTGFTPEISFEDGIKKTIDWARGQINENH